MQTVKHGSAYKYVHPIFQEIELFYSLTSDRHYTIKDNLIEPQVNLQFYYLQQIFNDLGRCDFDFLYYDKEFEKLHLPKYDSKNIVVCFSGGKDSVATALHYRKLGYNVYLYHLRGVNKEYPNEHIIAQNLAKTLGLLLMVEQVTLSGSHEYVEHPMKNMIIASCALQYAIRNGIGIKIAFGNYTSEDVDTEDDFQVNAADSQTMWTEFDYLIQNVIPEYRTYIFLKNFNSTFNILKDSPSLITNAISCMMPYRFREHKKAYVEKKFQVRLAPNRCGCCIKCAREYIYMADSGLIEYDENYYLYCLQICYNNSMKLGEKIETVDDLWKDNILYPKSKSKFKNKLSTIKIKSKRLIV